MAMDFIGLSVGMGYTDETVIGGGALKGKNCVVSNIEEVADGVNVTFQWTLDDGTVQTETAFIPRGTQGEAGVDGKSAYEIWLDAGNTGTINDFLLSLVGEKGENGKSAYQIWLDEGNTGTEQDFLDSLKGADGKMSFDDLTDEQKESLKGADGKSAYQIWLDEGNTGSEEDFLESLKGDGADVEFDDVPTENSENAIKSGAVYEALEGKQDCVTGGVSGQFLRKVNNSEPSRFEWVSHSNFVITGEVAFDEGGFIRGVTLDETYSLAKYAINKGQAVLCSLQDKNDSDTWYHLNLVRVSNNKIEFEGHLRKEDSIDTVYFSMDSNENYIGKRYTTEYMPKVTGTYGQIIGFDEDGNCIAKEEGEATKPYVVKMYYTLTDNEFQAIPASRTAKWADWYPFYEAGGEVILELHKDSVDSGDDIIRLYAHSKGIYNKTYNTLEVQFTAIGETTTYGTSNHTKYLYVCWWQSGNSCKVNRYKINEIPTGGTTGQALVKKSDTNYDAEWADVGGDEIIHTGLSGNLEGITTVLDLVNTLLEEYRAERKNVRFECGSLSNTNLTDLPQAYGYLTIKVGGTNIVEVTFAYSNLGFKQMYYGFINRTAGNELFDTLTWEKVATKSDLDALQTQIDELKSKIN